MDWFSVVIAGAVAFCLYRIGVQDGREQILQAMVEFAENEENNEGN